MSRASFTSLREEANQRPRGRIKDRMNGPIREAAIKRVKRC